MALRSSESSAGTGLIRAHRDARKARFAERIAAFQCLRERLLMAREDALGFEVRSHYWRQSLEEQALRLHALDRRLNGPRDKALRMLAGNDMRRLVVALPRSPAPEEEKVEFLWRSTLGSLEAARGESSSQVGQRELDAAADAASIMRFLEFIEVAAKHKPNSGLPELVMRAMEKTLELEVAAMCLPQLVRSLRSALRCCPWQRSPCDREISAFCAVLRTAIAEGAISRDLHVAPSVLSCCLSFVKFAISASHRTELLILAHGVSAHSLGPSSLHLDLFAPHLLQDPLLIAAVDESLALAFGVCAEEIKGGAMSPEVVSTLVLGKRLAPHRALSVHFVRSWLDLLTEVVLCLVSTGAMVNLELEHPVVFQTIIGSFGDIPLFFGRLKDDALVAERCILIARVLTTPPFGGAEEKDILLSVNHVPGDLEENGADPLLLIENNVRVDEWLEGEIYAALRLKCPTFLETLCTCTQIHLKNAGLIEQLVLLIHHLCYSSISARVSLMDTELPKLLNEVLRGNVLGTPTRIICEMCLENYLTPNGSW